MPALPPDTSIEPPVTTKALYWGWLRSIEKFTPTLGTPLQVVVFLHPPDSTAAVTIVAKNACFIKFMAIAYCKNNVNLGYKVFKISLRVQRAGRSNMLKMAAIGLFVLFTAIAHAQDDGQQASKDMPTDTKSQRAAKKKAEEREKAQKKATKEALEAHMKMQTPAVRKRMKEHMKEANREDEHKEPGFFYKLFHHHKKSKPSVKPGQQPS